MYADIMEKLLWAIISIKFTQSVNDFITIQIDKKILIWLNEMITFKFLYEYKNRRIYTMLKLSTCKNFEYIHDFVKFLWKIDDALLFRMDNFTI